MKTNNTEGCGLCNGTWGEYHRDIDGDNMFFCCNKCADAFENMVNRVKESTGWDHLDYVELKGNYSSGRECVARKGDEEFRYYFRTYSNGRILEFRER